ncbi:MAG: hypothetical protein DMG09_12610 [Acidobacteria bacterium]|nr:MAG: hypothetical protein DMG09_12610 [Acidobacteriota bacterium]
MSGFPRLIGTAFFLVFLACGTRVERQQSEPAPQTGIQEALSFEFILPPADGFSVPRSIGT